MSWLYSRALVEAFSAGTCSDGKPSAPLSETPTPRAYLSPDKMTDFSRPSQFGMTFAPLTADLGEALLTWFLEGFHAKTSAQPAKAPESPDSAPDCGEKWPASLARFDLDSRSWKTRQFLLLGDSALFSETWPRWGMMRNGECWERVTREPRIFERESGYWPTPRVVMPDNSKRKATLNPKTLRYEREDGESFSMNLADAVKMWPTPTARDWKSGKASPETMARNSRPLSEAVGGTLNPPWVEWLMGWPPGWTDLRRLATAKFLQWSDLHGRC